MSSNNIKPKLRFPQFSNSWEAKRIDEVTEKVSIPVRVNKSGLYQQIGIRSHGKGLFHKELVTGESLGNKRVFWVRENLFVVNIVFAWEQAVAKTTKAEIGMIASHRFPMFKPLENILDVDFLLTLFLTKKGKALLELASPGGAGRNKTLGQSEFAKLKINIPTLPEQQKIVAFLTAIYEKIQQLTKKKYLLEQYKKGVMQKIFNQEIRFKDDNGNDFADWENVEMQSIYPEIRNGFVGVATPFYTKTGVKYLQGKNVKNNEIKEDGMIFVSKEFHQKNKKSQLRANDIVMVQSGHVGECALITETHEGANCHALLVLTPKQATESKFYIYFFYSYFGKNLINKIKTGNTIEHILASDLKSVTVPKPSVPEQKKIAKFLSAIDEKINLVNQQLEKTKEYKKGLLQQMFI
jgi:type I restriction enzyme S subunit